MSLLSFAWHALWFARVIAHGVLLSLILKRKLYKEFPVFTGYTLVAVVFSSTLVVMNYIRSVSGDQYTHTFLAGEVAITAFSFAVIYEILQHIFRHYPSVKPLGVSLFQWTTFVLLAAAILFAWFAPASGPGQLMATFFVFRRSVNILVCGLLVLLCLFASYFGISRRSYLFGIVLGQGILSSVNLASAAIESQIEPVAKNYSIDLLKLIDQTAYLGSILVWIAYLTLSERKPPDDLGSLPPDELEDWSRELRRMSQP